VPISTLPLLGFLATLLAACTTTPAPTISQPMAQAKNYLATTLPDGSIEIIVTGKAGLPTGSQVAVIDLRDKLELPGRVRFVSGQGG